MEFKLQKHDEVKEYQWRINRIIMEFKCECDPHGRKEPSGINRIIMEFKSFIRVLFPELFKAELIES